MNLGVVTKQLSQYGGAEIYLLQCLKRWQYCADLTVYSPIISRALLTEYGLDLDRIKLVELEPKDETGSYDLLRSLVVLPRLWESQLGTHDLYLLNGAPLHFIRCYPSVFLCHEPLRLLYDLRYQTASDDSGQTLVHVYPEQEYRAISSRMLEVQMELLESLDRKVTLQHVVANSRKIADYVENVYGCEVDLVAYPGVDLPPQTRPPQGNRFVYVGRLWEHKRLALTIEALSLLPEGILDVIGVGPELENLQSFARHLGVEERVIFHGAVKGERLPEFFENALSSVYLPVREPFGIVPLEAAAAGRPCILTPESGCTEILDSEVALYVDPSPGAVARAMKSLMEQPHLARSMGAAARKRVEEHTWDHTATKLFSFLQTAARDEVGGTPCSQPLVGAHYYPWYDAGRPMRHWNENKTHAAVRDLPLQGAYTSREPETVERHLQLARQAGIDFFTVNLEVGQNGINLRDRAAVETLFQVSKSDTCGVKLSILLSIHTSLRAPLLEALKLVESLATHTAWLKLREKPALWFHVSNDFFGSYYAHKRMLQSKLESFTVVACGAIESPRHLPPDLRALVQGWSLYMPLRKNDDSTWEDHWESVYRAQTSGLDDPLRVFCVCPGYDDRHLSSPKRQRQETRLTRREDGKLYQRMWRCARRLNPEIVMITSFNEYHETTHIEPSFHLGDLYLRLTSKYVDSLKGSPVS